VGTVTTVSVVALFATCLGDQVFPATVWSACSLLEQAGYTVEFPAAQTCCGQPALTAGTPEAAARLARHYLDTFEPYEAVVAPSGSCAAMVRHWYPRLVGDDDRSRAQAVAARTHELTEFLAAGDDADEAARRPQTATAGTVTVHDACHGLRHLGTDRSIRAVLAAAGVEVREMEEPDTCCGFGGVFGATHGAVADALADRKLDDAERTGAEWIVACDAACLAHLEGRRRRTGVGPCPVHVADLLTGRGDLDAPLGRA
jgi:L-lactate dehydrogenase complex protein LldE